jgi:hypothetical protein
MTRFSVVAAAALFAAGCEGDDTDTGDTDGGGETDTDTPNDTDTDDPLPVDDCPDDIGTPVILSGQITEDMVLGPRCPWILSGGVFIGDDVSETMLTILPGTYIYGEGATNGFLAIRRGSKIMAEGTAAEPIVFTSDTTGSYARGQWGGLLVLGRAPINSEGGEDFVEGILPPDGIYGGTDPADNSGVLKYVRIQYGGIPLDMDVEINGLSLGGVGSGTTIDYIQVHANDDDGIEFFGGTVNVKHAVVSCPGDDGLDWDLGYVGNIQFALVTQGCDENGDNGIEADNHPTDHIAEPLSNPTLSNITLVGGTTNVDGYGVVLRRGTSGEIANAIVTDFPSACLAIRDAETYNNADLAIDHTILDCTTTYEDPEDGEAAVVAGGTGNSEADPMLVNPSVTATDPNFAPSAGSPAASGGDVPAGSFFDAATYLGAFDPAGPDWTDGWTNFDL